MLFEPQQLTILTTSKCTARCGHCSMNSGPERAEKLTFGEIRCAIDQLHQNGRLRVVIFAGGEPTILGEDLLDGIAHAADLGILTRVVTNAWWARSEQSARGKIAQLREAGLHELNISADDFHLPYIPFTSVVNAWRASKGMGFVSVSIANCYGPNSKVTPSFIQASLGEALPTRYDENGRAQPLPLPAADGTMYLLSNAYLSRIGRANDNVSTDDLIFLNGGNGADIPCPWAGRSPALSAANHLVACCGIEAEGNEVLDFGDMKTSSAHSLLSKAEDDVIINCIALFGPHFLKEFLRKVAPGLPFRPRYATMCEACEHVVRQPEALRILRENAGHLASLVLARRQQLGLERETPSDISVGGSDFKRNSGASLIGIEKTFSDSSVVYEFN